MNQIFYGRLVDVIKSGKFVCRGERQAKKPKIINEPYDIDAYEGTSIELPCQCEGEPQPEVCTLSLFHKLKFRCIRSFFSVLYFKSDCRYNGEKTAELLF